MTDDLLVERFDHHQGLAELQIRAGARLVTWSAEPHGQLYSHTIAVDDGAARPAQSAHFATIADRMRREFGGPGWAWRSFGEIMRAVCDLGGTAGERSAFERGRAAGIADERNSRRKARPEDPCYLYLIECPSQSRLKIGISVDPESRRDGLGYQAGGQTRVVTAALQPNRVAARVAERNAHRKFAHLRVGGEWFDESQEIRDYFDSMSSDVDL